jgi:hypothetical protein
MKSVCHPYCMGGELEGFMEWMMWMIGCAAAVVVGQLGLSQSDGSEPLTRAPFVLMVTTGVVCMFSVNGSLALMSFVMSNGSTLSMWLASACGIDDLLDRCATFDWYPGVARQLLHMALCAVALLQVSLHSNAYSADAHAAELVMRFMVPVGLMLVTMAFRRVTRVQLDLTEPAHTEPRDEDSVSVSAVDAVRRCMDLGLAAAAANLGLTTAAVAIALSQGRTEHCRDFHAVIVMQAMSGLIATFYMIMSVVALRTAAGRPPLSCTYTLWRGFIPVTTEPVRPDA